MALCGLVSLAATAADPLDSWQPSAYFNLNFGGPEKSNGYRFGAKMALSEQAVNRIYGGSLLLQAQRAMKGEKAGELPAYLQFDFNSGKDFTAQWLGQDVYRYDYVLKESSSPMANNFLGPFNAADSWAMIVTGSVVGAAGLGYGISQWTSSRPTAAALVAEAPPPPPPPLVICDGVVLCGPIGGPCIACPPPALP